MMQSSVQQVFEVFEQAQNSKRSTPVAIDYRHSPRLPTESTMCTIPQAMQILLACMLMALLRLVFHRAQRSHNVDWLRLTCDLLKFGVINAHEDVVLLEHLGMFLWISETGSYLFVANGELALGFFVRLGILVEFLDGVVVKNFLCKLDVALGIFVSGVNFGVVRQGR